MEETPPPVEDPPPNCPNWAKERVDRINGAKSKRNFFT
jgi:hypothetical protein